MGRVSKELKEVKAKAEAAFPVANVDYHIVKVDAGEKLAPGALRVARKRAYIHRDFIVALLGQHKRGEIIPPYHSGVYAVYALYPGPKPNPKWGKVCP